MKRLLLTLLLLLPLAAGAQNMAVKAFYLDESDQTANHRATMKYDMNGSVAALIRIQTTQKGFAFDVGTLGIVDVDENHVGEVWVYVPHSVKKITIRHQQLGTLSDYYFPVHIESARTYVMQLITGTVHPVVEEAVTQQYVKFAVTPPTAVVYLDGQPLMLNGGMGSKMMPFGTYDYRVEAPCYKNSAGKVTVSDPDNAVEVTVTMKLSCGYIDVEGASAQGGTVFIDKEQVGTVPYHSAMIAAGKHTVMVVKELYNAFTQVVEVQSGEHTRLTPTLSADFAHLTLVAKEGAEIWVNGARRGTGRYTGDLPSGTYTVESRLASHRTATQKITVTPAMNGETIRLQEPTPIYGTLLVESTPMDASITIDGKSYGKTPRQISRLLVGSHEVRLTLSGYAPYSGQVTVEEGKTAQVTATLQNGRPIRIVCQQPGARIYVDGKDLGSSPYEGSLSFGSHTAYAMAGGKRSAGQSIDCPQGQGQLPQVELSFDVAVGITCNASSARLYLDGKYLGRGSGLYRMTVGSHTLTATADGYYDYSKVLSVDDDMSLTVNLRSGWTFVTASALGSTAPQLAAGLPFGQVWRVGWYVSVGTNFCFGFPASDAVQTGGITGDTRKLYITGVAGMVFRIGTRVWLNVGAGYGTRRLGQYTDDGQLIEVSYNRYQGLTFDAGATLRLGRFLITAGAQMIRDGEREESFGMAKAGVGFCF